MVAAQRCRVPARRPGNFLLLAQKKVTKEESLNTDLAKQLCGKSSRLGVTERFTPFPRGLARRVAASYFFGLEFTPFDREHFRSSGPAEPIV
jgi:hypothetical protein